MRKKYLHKIKKPNKLVWSQLMYLYLLNDKFWIFESLIFVLSKKINYTSWIHIFSKKWHQKLVLIPLINLYQLHDTFRELNFYWIFNIFFFCRKLISCSFKIELVLWIFESSFGRICKLISYYKRVVNEKKAVVSNYWTR